MATAAEVIERLAPLTGLLPSTLDRQTRAQRLADQLPTAGHGGGRYRSRHYDAHHLTAVLLGLAGAQPSDAPEAFAALRSMPYRGTQNPQPDVSPPLPTFEDQLADWIRNGAAAYRTGKAAADACYALFRTMELALCLNPRQAIINIGPGGPGQTTIIYAANPDMPFALRRLTILSGDLLMAAGELVADTIEQHDAIACVQFLASTQPAKAPKPVQFGK